MSSFRLNLIFFSFAIFWLSACNSATDSGSAAQLKNIYGIDERVEADTDLHPYSTLGRLNSGCTGFLIGKKLVATAAHCVVDSNTGRLKTQLSEFSMAYEDGKPNIKTNILNAWIGSFNPEENRLKDWAILEIEDALGEERGVLRIRDTNFSQTTYPVKISLAGYQTDFKKAAAVGLDKSCHILKQTEEDRLFFDCDSASGISGAPLLAKFDGSTYAIGLAVSEFRQGAAASVRRDSFSDDYANAGIGITNLIIAANELFRTVDQDTANTSVSNAFFIALPEPKVEVVQKKIELLASSAFSGGVFQDSTNQIHCDNMNSQCSALYDQGSSVTLYAPPTLNSNGRNMRFSYWFCSLATESFPGRVNRCRTSGRNCTVKVNTDLKCSAWYQ